MGPLYVVASHHTRQSTEYGLTSSFSGGTHLHVCVDIQRMYVSTSKELHNIWQCVCMCGTWDEPLDAQSHLCWPALLEGCVNE